MESRRDDILVKLQRPKYKSFSKADSLNLIPDGQGWGVFNSGRNAFLTTAEACVDVPTLILPLHPPNPIMELKNVTLRHIHEKLGARMVPFAGFNMPVRYSSDLEEHMAVRNGVGVFDVSHMGEFLVTGNQSLDLIQRVTSNDASALRKLSKPTMIKEQIWLSACAIV